MSGKMQESGVIEIISLIYTLATILTPSGCIVRVAAVADGLMALTSFVG